MSATAFETALEKDLSNAFFAEFSTVVLVTPTSGTPYSINAIFDKAHEIVTPDTNMGVSSTHPVLNVYDSSLTHNINTDKATLFTIKGKQYKINDIQPDGVGTTLILLHEK